ncbi:MAG TPA: hypothetical protein VJS91_05385 [Nitrososphaeraceae archaeon]|nr:hypothetical protein [Nitrososphaeraceae archaeon]
MLVVRWKQWVNFYDGTISSNLLSFYFKLSFFTIIFLSVSAADSYAQTSSGMNNSSMQQHAEHIVDNLIISEHIPLRGQLENGDYILLMDLTPFATSIEGHSHIAMKVPCNEDGTPKVSIVTGIAPNLNSLDFGNAINNGTLNGKYLDLSSEGNACLYHAELPQRASDIALVNTSNETLNFDKGRYYSVTFTIHATAIQHLADNQTGT